ncbi:MAG: type II toxin-antitoxin system PemK/MazF family toxin [Elusimicrobia bacterium]|nr:type II toxin-antitoxin system PemK/MazF family toxin [Elusimicrobiota bacterium]
MTAIVRGIFPRRGEIYLARLPNQPSYPKNRPALVISLDARNQYGNDTLVIPIATNLRPAPTHVLLPRGEGGLREDSMAKCEQITTLDKSFLIRGPFAGVISAAKIIDIEKAIQRAIGIPA